MVNFKNVCIYIFKFVVLCFVGFNLYSTPMMRQVPSAFDPSVMVIDEKKYLGKIIDNFYFVLEDGSEVSVVNFISNKPLIILPIFYKCMTGCPLILGSSIRAIQNINGDFNFIVLSFDKNDTISNLVEFKNSHAYYVDDSRIKFGILKDEYSVNKFTNSTGFKFFFSKPDNTFVHTLVLIFISPDGKIVRYLFGSSQKEYNIKMALREARIGKFSFNSLIDLAFVACFTYDSRTQSYYLNPAIIFGGFGFILVLFTLTTSYLLWRRKWKT